MARKNKLPTPNRLACVDYKHKTFSKFWNEWAPRALHATGNPNHLGLFAEENIKAMCNDVFYSARRRNGL